MSRTPPRVVAELGRPETPQETADRRTAASAKRRANQTAFNLVIALVASLGIVAFLVLVVVRPDGAGAPPIDYAAAARDAQGDADADLVVPRLPDGWTANRAEYEGAPADGVPRWGIGFLTPDDDGDPASYIGLTQGIGADRGWAGDLVDDARATGTVSLGGVEWTVYDRREADDPGNLAYSLVAGFDDADVVLSGTATDEEFAVLATAVAEELDGETGGETGGAGS